MAARALGDPGPFDLPGAAGDPRGVLLVHGFTGTPFEMHLLGAHLHGRGYGCVAPLLRGHNASVAALARTGWQDWLGSAEEALLALHARLAAGGQAPRIAVVGLSMGGLLTLELCRRHEGLIRAIALLATPLWLPPWQTRAIRALTHRASPLRGLSLPKLLGPDVREPGMRRENPSTRGMPLRALGSLLDLMDHVRPGLGAVRQPALIAHGALDHTAPYGCMAALLAGLGTPRADLHGLTLPQSYHLVTLDIERQLLFDAIVKHLDSYLRT